MTPQDLKKLENDLWSAADNLRANSDLKASAYSTPVLGLILLMFADNNYRRHEAKIIADCHYNALLSSKPIKAVILDAETTGTDHLQDQVVELGMVAFDYCPETGQIDQVHGTFNELEDRGLGSKRPGEDI